MTAAHPHVKERVQDISDFPRQERWWRTIPVLGSSTRSDLLGIRGIVFEPQWVGWGDLQPALAWLDGESPAKLP